MIITQLFDMHCHLEFSENCEAIAEGVADDIQAVCATVMPSSFVSVREKLGPYRNIYPALGVHPYWIARGRISEVDVSRFGNLVGETGIISEIGLDFSSRRRATKDLQIKIFMRLLDCIRQAGSSRLIFLHAVNSYDDLISLMDQFGTFDDNMCVLHWFAGCDDSFMKLLSRNCMFSISTRMLSSAASAMFAKSVPDDALLIETDMPSHVGDEWSADMWREELWRTVKLLSDLRDVPIGHILDVTARNSALLLRNHDMRLTAA